ncbi:MAG: bacterial transcriptional activator domain-containing protein, partial [Candidatus Brocadiaceae bacterium]
GRNKTLEEWIASIPGEIRESTPWLLYWFGICRFLYNNPAESRTYFDKAFEQFRAQGDFTGIWLSWAYAVDTFFHEFDNFSPFDSYIQIFEELIQQMPVFPSPEIEFRVISCRFICMMLRQPDHPEIKIWAERVFALLQKCSDVNLCLQTGFYLAVHYVCMGDFVRAGILIDLLRKRAQSETAMPLMRLLEKTVEVFYSLNTGSSGLCIQHVSEALAYAHETGVHVWDNHVLSTGACAALNDGDVDTATQLLQKIEPGLATARKIDVGFYHHISAMKEMLMGNLSLAAEHIQINVRILSEINAHFALTLGRITMSHVYAALGKYPEAVAQLSLARQIGLWMKSKHIEYICLLTEAYFALELGIKGVEELSNAETIKHLPFSPAYDKCKESDGKPQLPRSPFDKGDAGYGLGILRRAMALGREQNFTGCFIWRFDIMPRLCVKALEAGIEVEYVRSLIRKRNLVPDVPPIHCEDWPWQIKIFTLGRFRILHDEKPIQFAGKVQQKPLEMLKAILSIRGGEAPEDPLADALWPDAEGDAAHRAFEITLHRLRRLMGSDKAVKRQGGLVSLDKRYCWVDMVAFERIAENIEDMRREMEKRGIGEWKKPPTHITVSPLVPLSEVPSLPIIPPQTEIFRLMEKAINVYKGSFLPTESRYVWTVSTRERLRDKFRHLVIALGVHLEQTGQWENAAEHYRKAIEKDGLAEAFYQRLMMCYQQLGLRAQGVEIYHRLKSALSEAFGIEPSPQTESLYKSLIAARISGNS